MIFVEGMGDILLPCAAAIVVPGLLVAVAGRQYGRGSAVVFAASVGVGLWMRASGLFTSSPQPLLVGLGFLVAAAAFLRGHRSTALIGSVITGAMAAWMWQPCVGIHLGEALTTATRDAAGAFVPLMAYALGLCWVVVGLALLARLRPFRRVLLGRGALNVSAASLGVLAVLAAAGWYEELVARLLQSSVQ